MAHNKELANKQKLTDGARTAIDELHEMRHQIMCHPNMYFKNTEEAVEALHGIAFALQWLWSFPLSKTMHKDVEAFEFNQKWRGRKFKCTETNVEFTIPDNVKERDYFLVGNGALDLGRLKLYSRIVGNIEEVDK